MGIADMRRRAAANAGRLVDAARADAADLKDAAGGEAIVAPLLELQALLTQVQAALQGETEGDIADD